MARRRTPAVQNVAMHRRRGPGVVVAVVVVLGTTIGFSRPASATPAWTVVPSANPAGPPLGVFSGVTCLTTTNCLAVGFEPNGPGASTLVEQWNGTAWSQL